MIEHDVMTLFRCRLGVGAQLARRRRAVRMRTARLQHAGGESSCVEAASTLTARRWLFHIDITKYIIIYTI